MSTVKALLANNADPRYQDMFGQTPSMLAADTGHESVATLLYREECKRQSIDGGSDGVFSLSPCVDCQSTYIKV